jgi:GH15 family glucan-1,4-alpha-glucosidase
MLRGLAKVVRGSWRGMDSGIWEIRGEPRHYTFSKMMCWAALDRALALHRMGAVPLGRAEETACLAERDAIAAVIEARGFNVGIGAYTLELDGNGVDAAMLLMPVVGYKPADDPRVVSTYTLTCERLAVGGLLQRYQAGADGLEGDEGAFGICSFWAVEQLALRGDVTGASVAFERLLSFGNDLGLFAEEIDSRTGEALGNFPQAFTHVGLINAVLAIQRATEGEAGP